MGLSPVSIFRLRTLPSRPRGISSVRSGLSQTEPIGVQSRVLPDQRPGQLADLAAPFKETPFLAAVALFGVTKRIALWRCWRLYPKTKPWTQVRAAPMLAKPRVGQSGRYLQVRKRASEKGVSLETRGRLKEAMMPSPRDGMVAALPRRHRDVPRSW